MNAFYKRVHELCEQKNMTHGELAEEIGVTAVTFSRYMTLQRTVGLMPFMAMCKVFEVEPENLYKTYLFARMRKRVANYVNTEKWNKGEAKERENE